MCVCDSECEPECITLRRRFDVHMYIYFITGRRVNAAISSLESKENKMNNKTHIMFVDENEIEIELEIEKKIIIQFSRDKLRA